MENQLLYAILQVDRREGDLKLQCRWLDELSKLNDQMITECDRALDQIRAQQRAAAQRDKKQGKKMEKKEVPTKFFLRIDIDKVRFSHILELKALFRQFPGKTPLVVEFSSSTQSHGKIHVDQRWGITLEKELEMRLRKLSSVVNFEADHT